MKIPVTLQSFFCSMELPLLLCPTNTSSGMWNKGKGRQTETGDGALASARQNNKSEKYKSESPDFWREHADMWEGQVLASFHPN